ncbi:type II 3-dehydroquinate dehydratase [Elioraea tepidiphila]|uniref:type II 3-dehydroquinate dehydratase n=1 Tax=Elioraea tepidiphila TaxID=457934 RepID=UPI00036707B7|nr:type II 3-dehydroquinate dehydratase [Elioraea tepidiphila]
MAAPLVAVYNGPNLNLLGTRQPELYGRTTLADVEALCEARAAAHGLAIEFRQSNHEGELIDWVQSCRNRAAGIVINPGGLSHTSIALLDALLATDLPVIEVHVTNIHRREAFRHTSITGKAATGIIAGLGPSGYGFAIEAMAGLLGLIGTGQAAPRRMGGTAR